MDLEYAARSAGVHALTSIVIELMFITMAWYVLQELNFEKLLRRPRSIPARLLQAMLAIAIGHLLGDFAISYWDWSKLLKGLVE